MDTAVARKRTTNSVAPALLGPAVTVQVSSPTEIQQVLLDGKRYPSPVRPIGSGSSTTRCVTASGGTQVDLSAMNRVLKIERDSVTVQPGISLPDLAEILSEEGLELGGRPGSSAPPVLLRGRGGSGARGGRAEGRQRSREEGRNVPRHVSALAGLGSFRSLLPHRLSVTTPRTPAGAHAPPVRFSQYGNARAVRPLTATDASLHGFAAFQRMDLRDRFEPTPPSPFSSG